MSWLVPLPGADDGGKLRNTVARDTDHRARPPILCNRNLNTNTDIAPTSITTNAVTFEQSS